MKCHNMRTLCTEIGNEIYPVYEKDEFINSNEKEGKKLNIYLVFSMIEAFYKYYQNTNVSVLDLFKIIYNNNNNDNNLINEQESHKLLFGVFLPKISKKTSIPII